MFVWGGLGENESDHEGRVITKPPLMETNGVLAKGGLDTDGGEGPRGEGGVDPVEAAEGVRCGDIVGGVGLFEFNEGLQPGMEPAGVGREGRGAVSGRGRVSSPAQQRQHDSRPHDNMTAHLCA